MSTNGNIIMPGYIPGTPLDPRPSTYTRFAGRDLEAYEYSGWVDETLSWKQSCYIGNWSTLRKSLITGPGAMALFSRAGINGFNRFDIGQAKHFVMCTDDGFVAGEGVLMRLEEEKFLLTSSPAVVWLDVVVRRESFAAEIREVTRDWFIFQLQGPQALHVLEKVSGERIRDLAFMRFRPLKAGDIPFYALRQGMSGEIGYELHGSAEVAEDLYRAILNAGGDFAIRQLGGRAKMVNHAEACFPTPSVDFIPAYLTDPDYVRENGPPSPPNTSGSFEYSDLRDLFRTPIELGWAKSIRWDHDFIGKAALEREHANPRRQIVTLVWNADDVLDIHASYYRDGEDIYDFLEYPRNLLGCMHADRVLSNGRPVGVSTSRTYSVHFRKMISLCTIDVAQAEPGTQVEVVWGRPTHRQKHVRATVASAPFKPDRRRADLSAIPLLPL